MKPNKELVDHIVSVMNRAFAADPKAIENLCNTRVSCNKILADDPTIQVGFFNDGQHSVGLLGILNGLVGVDERLWGWIAAIYQVECPSCGILEANKDLVVGNLCKVEACALTLELGRLINFVSLEPK